MQFSHRLIAVLVSLLFLNSLSTASASNTTAPEFSNYFVDSSKTAEDNQDPFEHFITQQTIYRKSGTYRFYQQRIYNSQVQPIFRITSFPLLPQAPPFTG